MDAAAPALKNVAQRGGGGGGGRLINGVEVLLLSPYMTDLWGDKQDK